MEVRRVTTFASLDYVEKHAILAQIILVYVSTDFSSRSILADVFSFTGGRLLVDFLHSAMNHVTFSPKHGHVTQDHVLKWPI